MLPINYLKYSNFIIKLQPTLFCHDLYFPQLILHRFSKKQVIQSAGYFLKMFIRWTMVGKVFAIDLHLLKILRSDYLCQSMLVEFVIKLINLLDEQFKDHFIKIHLMNFAKYEGLQFFKEQIQLFFEIVQRLLTIKSIHSMCSTFYLHKALLSSIFFLIYYYWLTFLSVTKIFIKYN